MLPTLDLAYFLFHCFIYLFPQGNKKEGTWLLGLIVWITGCMHGMVRLSATCSLFPELFLREMFWARYEKLIAKSGSSSWQSCLGGTIPSYSLH